MRIKDLLHNLHAHYTCKYNKNRFIYERGDAYDCIYLREIVTRKPILNKTEMK